MSSEDQILKSSRNNDTEMDFETEQSRKYAALDANATLSTVQETLVKIRTLPSI